jgi:hypothetical protein
MFSEQPDFQKEIKLLAKPALPDRKFGKMIRKSGSAS